jgi:hypothetical protein
MVHPDQVVAQQARPKIAPLSMNGAEAKVIEALRKQGDISRTDITVLTGWSKAKTSQKIRELVNKGLLVEVGEGASQGGRRPRLLRINDRLGYLVGLDIGATSLDIALADVGGKICQRRSALVDIRQSPEEYLKDCRALILEMVSAQGCLPEQILGIGIGVPGPVDFKRGVLVAPPLMPDWENFLIADFFHPAFPHAFVVVDNDVNIMALGEQRAGDGAGIDHFIFVKIGTGIGSGMRPMSGGTGGPPSFRCGAYSSPACGRSRS